MTPVWAPGAATGVGSLPGTDPAEAAKTVVGELPEFPFLPELPARGPGADMIGRGAALLVDLPVEIQPSGWRITSHPGRDLRRAQDFWSWDRDAIEAQAAAGPLKVAVAGPWTLAASVELPSGHRVLADHGATRDLAASLAEGIRGLLASLAARVPSATVVLQLDEPSLPAVLAAQVPTASGYGTLRAVEASVVTQTLESVLSVADAGRRVVHCCAPSAPIGLFRTAGADAVSVDLTALTSSAYDAVGEAVDAGTVLLAGVVPSTDAPIRFETARDLVVDFWQRLGMPMDSAAGLVVPTPTCGLAGASAGYARRAMSVVRDVGRALGDLQ